MLHWTFELGTFLSTRAHRTRRPSNFRCPDARERAWPVFPPPVGEEETRVNILVGVTARRRHGKRVISAPSKPLKLKLAGHLWAHSIG